jgi:paraquat-inducible protein B
VSRRASPTAIGAFVLGAIALAVVGVVMFGAGILARPKASFILYFQESVNGLDVGAPVKFKGVQLGRVTRILLGYEQKPGITDVAVLIELDERAADSEFGRQVDLADRELMREAIARGLRARLESQSLVTGLLYVELGFYPGTPARYLQAGDRYMEIPTIPSNLQEIVSRAMQAVARISQLPIEDMVKSFTELAKSTQGFVDDPKLREAVASMSAAAKEAEAVMRTVRKEVEPVAGELTLTADEARRTLVEFRTFAESAQGIVRDGSPLRYQLSDTLSELTQAARSLRLLTDYLERDPQALLTGKNPVEP